MRGARAVLAALVAVLAPAGRRVGSTLQVNTTADPARTSLRRRRGQLARPGGGALAGNADTINVPLRTYTLALGELSLVDDHIVGAGAPDDRDQRQRREPRASVTGTSNTVAGVTIRNGNGVGTTAAGRAAVCSSRRRP